MASIRLLAMVKEHEKKTGYSKMSSSKRIKLNEECLKKLSKIKMRKYHSPEELKMILDKISDELPVAKEKDDMIILDKNNPDDME